VKHSQRETMESSGCAGRRQRVTATPCLACCLALPGRSTADIHLSSLQRLRRSHVPAALFAVHLVATLIAAAEGYMVKCLLLDVLQVHRFIETNPLSLSLLALRTAPPTATGTATGTAPWTAEMPTW